MKHCCKGRIKEMQVFSIGRRKQVYATVLTSSGQYSMIPVVNCSFYESLDKYIDGECLVYYKGIPNVKCVVFKEEKKPAKKKVKDIR